MVNEHPEAYSGYQILYPEVVEGTYLDVLFPEVDASSTLEVCTSQLRTDDLTISMNDSRWSSNSSMSTLSTQSSMTITYAPSGSELPVSGRTDTEMDSDAVSHEKDGVFVYFQRLALRGSNALSRTNLVKAKRKIALRTDMGIAKDPAGGNFVRLIEHRDLPSGPGKDIFSGMRLQVLDTSDAELVLVDDLNGNQGWLPREHLEGLGAAMLNWAGPEIVLDDKCLNGDYFPILVH